MREPGCLGRGRAREGRNPSGSSSQDISSKTLLVEENGVVRKDLTERERKRKRERGGMRERVTFRRHCYCDWAKETKSELGELTQLSEGTLTHRVTVAVAFCSGPVTVTESVFSNTDSDSQSCRRRRRNNPERR